MAANSYYAHHLRCAIHPWK